MFCTNCGKQLPEGTVFCTQCGTRQAAAAPQQVSAAPVQAHASASGKGGNKWIAWVGGGVALLAILLLFILLIFRGGAPRTNTMSGFWDGALSSEESGRVACTMMLNLDKHGLGKACMIVNGQNITGAGLDALYKKGKLELSGKLSGESVYMMLGAAKTKNGIALTGEGESSLPFTLKFTQTSQAELTDVIEKAVDSPAVTGTWYSGELGLPEESQSMCEDFPATADQAALDEEFGVDDYATFLWGIWASDPDPDGYAVIFRFDPDNSKAQAMAAPLNTSADAAAWNDTDWQVDEYTWSDYFFEDETLFMREWDYEGYYEWTIEIYDEGTISISAGEGDSYILHRIGMVVESDADKNITDYTLLYTNGNVYAVENGPDIDVSVSSDMPTYVQAISTYHWNDAKGKAPGSISIEDENGNVLGTWDAVGREGYLGVPNAYWDVFPNVVLEAGTGYYVVDSDNNTWSYNSDSESGFVEIRGYYLNDN